MKIHNVEFDFRVYNVKHAAAMEMALKNMEKREKQISAAANNPENPASVIFAETIGMFRTFFVETTGTDVLKDCEDLMEARKAYTDFLGEINRQKAEVLAPYAPDDIK